MLFVFKLCDLNFFGKVLMIEFGYFVVVFFIFSLSEKEFSEIFVLEGDIV